MILKKVKINRHHTFAYHQQVTYYVAYKCHGVDVTHYGEKVCMRGPVSSDGRALEL